VDGQDLSALARLRVDVVDQPTKVRFKRFARLLRAVTSDIHRVWCLEVTDQLAFQSQTICLLRKVGLTRMATCELPEFQVRRRREGLVSERVLEGPVGDELVTGVSSLIHAPYEVQQSPRLHKRLD
jgi:hypothetical protein